MDDDDSSEPVFACCSAGIGRWFWVAWASEDDAIALAPPLATGFEKSADLAATKAAEKLGAEPRRLPGKRATAFRGGGSKPARPVGRGREPEGVEEKPKPASRFGRPKPSSAAREPAKPRLSFLYSATPREPPDSLGHVTVIRHRIVKQNPRKAHVECDPFDEAEWERLNEPDSASDEFIPRSRTVAVDRLELRREGRFQCGRSQGGQTFYATEDAAIRDVEATLTAKYDWCATLGVEFPCSKDEIKAAYRRLALSSHPDRGGDPAEFRRIEQAHREALAYFS